MKPEKKNTPSGILIVDKPSDISSAGVVARIKRICGLRKVGHGGTLDPFATGLLICGINQGTRLSRFFLHEEKSYEAELMLGITTDTQDATGTVTDRFEEVEKIAALPLQAIESVLASFTGPQQQLPPVYSALKHEGVPLYKLARKGTPVQKPPRDINIYAINLISAAPPSIRFSVSCSAGTYIRTLSNDIGAKLGFGGHLTALRRTSTCGFGIERATPLEEIEALASEGRIEERLIGLSDAVAHLPAHVAGAALAARIANGGLLSRADGIIPPEGEDDGFLRVIDPENRLLAVISFKKASDSYDYCCVFNN